MLSMHKFRGFFVAILVGVITTPDDPPSQIERGKSLVVPEVVTYAWMKEHVPMSLWLKLAGILMGGFMIGFERATLIYGKSQ